MERAREAGVDTRATARRSTRIFGGLGLVALAAALWGSDGVLRGSLADSFEVPAATVVFWEHVILVVLTIPWLRKALVSARRMGARDWASIIVIGAGASAVATVLFTAAFSYGDFTAPLLLQKLQPLLAIVAARVLLGERIRPRFLWFLGAGLAGAWLIAFSSPTSVSVTQATAAVLALGAAALWGLGTVLGRHMTGVLEPNEVTALRFAIGLPTAGLIGLVGGGVGSFVVTGQEAGTLVVLALIPGLLAMTLYYRGLRSTPASLATLAELAFPVSAITLNWLVFGTTITGSQWTGVLLLSVTLVVMSLTSRSAGVEALGVEIPGRRVGWLRRPVPESS